MRTLWQDVSYGARMLAKQRSFTVVAALALALGIGANSAIFSVVNAVVLRPLPYPEPEQLVVVWGRRAQQGLDGMLVAPANYYDWRDTSRTFAQMGAYTEAFFNLTAGGEPERIAGIVATPNLFAALGVEPVLGRLFLAEEEQPGHNQAVVLSYGLWQRRFGADPGVIGKSISLNGNQFTVVGVLSSEFLLANRSYEAFIPFAPGPQQRSNRAGQYLTVVARLAPGATLAQAQAEMAAITARLEQQHPEANAGNSANVVPLHKELFGQVQLALFVLLAAVGFVLLIACANVANLLLARSAGRQREIAIRAALGASRRRIVRQLLTESLLLAAIGGAAGLLLAWWGIDLLVSLSPADLPRAAKIGIDRWVLGFTLVVSLLTGLVFGLAPALQASRLNLNEALKEGGRDTGSRGRTRARSLLVISEVAISVVLLAGAGLMMKSFLNLRAVDPGFQPENIVTMDISLPADYAEHPQRSGFFQQLIERVESLPGVRAAGVTSHLPLSGEEGSRTFTMEGRPAEEKWRVGFRRISSGYFSAMGVPLLQGRTFTAQDNAEAQGVVIINQTLARRFFGQENPLGKRLLIEDGPPRPREIVGVVGDVRHAGLGADVRPELYVSHLDRTGPNMTLVVRATGDATGLVAAVRGELAALDRSVPLANAMTMEQYMVRSVAQERFQMILLGLFATVALLLAALGIYGVVSYAVAQRTHEIGIRLALGAQGSDIFKLIVGQGMRQILTGVTVGLAAALALMRLMSGLLFGVSASDPLTFLSISLLLIGVAFMACYIPARRALRVEPMEALRYE